MTIQEAIKSGKKFKRKHWPYYYVYSSHNTVDCNDIMATDWEVEPEPEQKIEITKAQLKNACEGWNYVCVDILSKRLGFKE